VVILGLDEAGAFAATGLDNPSKMASDLADMCSDEMEPALRPYIQIHKFEGVQLLVAEVGFWLSGLIRRSTFLN
jgi:ATP-dependent DNA helicase RecG